MESKEDEFKLDSETASNIVASQLTAYHELQNRAKSIVRITLAAISVVIAAIGSGVLELSRVGIPEPQQFEGPFTVSTDLISNTIAVSLLISFLLIVLGTYTIAYAYADLLRLLKPRTLKPIFSSGSEPYEVTTSTSQNHLTEILNNNNRILNKMQSDISTAYNSFLITFVIGMFIFLVAVSLTTGDITSIVLVLIFLFWTTVAILSISIGGILVRVGGDLLAYISNIDKYAKLGHLSVAVSYILRNIKTFIKRNYKKANDLTVNNGVIGIGGFILLILSPAVGILSWTWTVEFVRNIILPLT
ncbi:hypothetical protein [Halorubrum kocurii]|uniref:hypothetical protein n=1 Tax=Halorubrum kocurii TaxID=478441 RepID=UPI0012686E47|nr:hypothetical protein [Halorubrum kocurii]